MLWDSSRISFGMTPFSGVVNDVVVYSCDVVGVAFIDLASHWNALDDADVGATGVAGAVDD